MTRIRLGIGFERETTVLFWLTRKPLLLFGHGSRVGTEKGQSVESIAHYVVIQLSRLRVTEELLRFVDALQGQRVVSEICVVGRTIRLQAQGFFRDLQGFFILPLLRKHCAEIAIRSRT